MGGSLYWMMLFHFVQPSFLAVFHAAFSISASGDIVYDSTRAILGVEGGGIGAFAIHPSGKLIAVGAKSDCSQGASPPRIYFYSLPSLQLICAPLTGGTDRAFADINFRFVLPRLCCIGSLNVMCTLELTTVSTNAPPGPLPLHTVFLYVQS